jgi:hypothetical protein
MRIPARSLRPTFRLGITSDSASHWTRPRRAGYCLTMLRCEGARPMRRYVASLLVGVMIFMMIATARTVFILNAM